MKKFNRLSVIAAAGSLVVTSALTVSMPSANAVDCTGTVAIMAPLTGGVAFIGVEQANFAKLAVADYNKKNGTTFTTTDLLQKNPTKSYNKGNRNYTVSLTVYDNFELSSTTSQIVRINNRKPFAVSA